MVMESPTPRLEIFIIPLKLKKLISQVKNFHNLKKPRDTGINSWMFHTNAMCWTFTDFQWKCSSVIFAVYHMQNNVSLYKHSTGVKADDAW